MEREKMIEELAKDIAQCCVGNRLIICKDDMDCSRCRAEWLSKMNYRKIPEGSVVLTKEELETTDKIPQKIKDFYKRFIEIEREQACKETAKKIFSAIDKYSDKCFETVDNGIDCETYNTFDYCKFFRWFEKYAKKFGVEVE